MQKILNISKYIILALVSCTLVFTLNSSNDFSGMDLNLSSLSMSSIDDTTSVTKPATVWGNMSSQFVLDHQEQSSQVQSEIRNLLADQDKQHKILVSAAPYK